MPPQPYLVELLGGSEGVMPYRVNPLVSAAFIGSLAAAMFLCPNWAAWAAGECISKPDQEVNQAGHWYYYVGRGKNLFLRTAANQYIGLFVGAATK